MRPFANWLIVIVIAAGLVLTVGMALAVSRETPITPPVGDGPLYVTDGVRGWACPEGTVTKVTCGYVEVPADYDDPEAEKAELFLGLFDDDADGDAPPLVVIGDRIGPGVVGDPAVWRRVSRDMGRGIVLVDLRGTGSSQPQISCVDLLKTNWLEVDLGDEAAVELVREQRRAGVDRCLTRLVEKSPALDFTIETMARDLEQIRRQLAIDQWVVVGSGATAEVAVAYEARDPAGVASMVLLGAAPATDEPLTQRREYGREALLAALDCGRPDCQGNPDLGRLLKAEEALGRRSVVFTAPVGGARRRVSVDQGSLYASLARAVGQPEIREGLPDLIEGLVGRQWRQVAILRGRQFPTLEYGLISASLGVSCRSSVPELSDAMVVDVAARPADAESTDGRPDEELVSSLENPANWLSLADDPLLDRGLCRPVDSVGVPLGRVPESPVLIVNQAFDHRAPASAAEEIGDAWPDAEVVVLEVGEPPDLRAPCVAAAVSEFLGDASTLEGSC